MSNSQIKTCADVRRLTRLISTILCVVLCYVLCLAQENKDIVFKSYELKSGFVEYNLIINKARLSQDPEKSSKYYKQAVLSDYLQQDHCQMIMINEFRKNEPDVSCINFLSEKIDRLYPGILEIIARDDVYWGKEYPNYTCHIRYTPLNLGKLKLAKRTQFYSELMQISASIRNSKETLDSFLYRKYRIPSISSVRYIDSIISHKILDDIQLNGYPKAKTDNFITLSNFYYCCLHQSFSNSELEIQFWTEQKKAVENGWISNNRYAYLMDHTYANKSRLQGTYYFVLLEGVNQTTKDISIVNYEDSEKLRKELYLPTLCAELSRIKQGYYTTLPNYCK